MEKRYLTTSIPYMNAAPHIGHALEAIQADVLARWYRLNGHPTWFLTGTDEHGAKIAKLAADEGVEPKVVADRNSAIYAKFPALLNLSTDDFIRTSDKERHWPGAQKLWKQLTAADDIYKDKYTGLYCVGCEAFVTEKDLVDGKCPYHKSEPERIEEENYFFRLSKYADQIAEKIKTKELEIIPEGRAKETLNVIAELTDISFSRPVSKLPWGVPVPDDPSQTMYVWCDALANYISAIGYGSKDETEFNKWWPADLHVLGKDIMRFHTIIWPGMLLSAGLPLPKKILVHGFITSNGQKMSKSIGNVVDPKEAIDAYGVDALRYYLLREIPTTDDGDFSWKRFEDLYNHELADNLGNLLSRVIQMAEKFCGGKVPQVSPNLSGTAEAVTGVEKYLESLDFQKAVLAINQLISQLNVLVDEKKPWELAKAGNQTETDAVLYQLLEGLRITALLLAPFLPETAGKIYFALGLSDVHQIDNWPEAVKWGQLPADTALRPTSILFPKKS
ncbi:MAG: methionine--tRNA ligase [Patescibacteria group bacterium]